MQDDRNIKIFKELKRRINYLQNELNYDVAFIALQGSQNYGMDIFTNEYQSDIDCIAVVLPTLDEIIDNKNPVSTTLVLENNEHIVVKDFRLFIGLLYKQNIQYLEVLFTKYKIVNKQYKELLNPLFNKAEIIAKFNMVSVMNCIGGMAVQKLNALEHVYPSTLDRIEKYGYDGKSLHHLIRLFQFEDNLINGMEYGKSLCYFDPEIKDMCMRAKLSQYSLNEARALADKYINKIRNRKQEYLDNNELVEDDIAPLILTNVKSNVLKKYFTDELKCDILDSYQLCPDHYKNVWVTSDNHFGHRNILKYETGRLSMLDVSEVELRCRISNYIIDNNLDVDNDDDYAKAKSLVYKQLTEEQDREMIVRWNAKVAPNDLVLILGDFSFKSARETENLLQELNGDKVLIKGNHDIYLEDKLFNRSLFKAIYDYKETKYRKQEIALMHYPIQEFKHMDREGSPAILLFGHIHSGKVIIPKHSYNVGVDVNDYAPVNINKAIEEALNNNGGKINNV